METLNYKELCEEMPNLSINQESDVPIPPNKCVSDESDDGSPIYQVPPQYEEIPSEDESDTSPFYPPETHTPFPWEVSLAFAPGYLRIEPILLEMVHVDKTKMSSEEECSDSRESNTELPHPFYIPNGGPLNYFVDNTMMGILDGDRKSMSRRWGLIEGYDVVKPGLYDTVRYPPGGCIAVYDKAFELGLRFPLHPFSRRLLEMLNVTAAELYPNAWGCITAFILLSKGMGMEPSVTAFRHIFRARLCNSKAHGPGWITFMHRRSFKIVGDLPDSNKRFRTRFGYLYCRQGWNIKTSFDIAPKLVEFNNNVPICSPEEAIIIHYAQMEVQLLKKPYYIQRNWIPKKMDFNNELLLSAYDISLIYHKRVARVEVRKKYKQLMAKFSNTMAFAAAFRAADPQPPLPKPPLDSVTVTEALKDAPSHEEAQILLEARRAVPPPEDLASRAGPSSKKRKRAKSPSKKKKKAAEPTKENPVVVEDDEDSSSESMEQVVDAVPLSTQFPGVTIREPTGNSAQSHREFASGKGKQVMFEGEHIQEGNVNSSRLGVPFINLESSAVAGRFNKASRILVTQDDLDYLDSMDPTERLQKAQSAMAEGLIRMIFETSKIQQNEVDQETIRALTARVDELNDKTASLRAKLKQCRDLSKRIDAAEEWRARLKDILADTCTKLERATNYASRISIDFAGVRKAINQASAQIQKVSSFVDDLLKKVGTITEAAQFYKFKSERRARIAKDWLLSEEGSTFMARLSGEMINNGLQVEACTTKSGMQLKSENGSRLLALSLRVGHQLDLDASAPEVPEMPMIPESSVFTSLEARCMDLSGNLTMEKEAILDLSTELGAKEPFSISIDELLRSEPASPQPQPPPDSAN